MSGPELSGSVKACSHVTPHFGCRSCIAAASPGQGNVAQTGRTLEEREEMMNVFVEEERVGRGDRERAAAERHHRQQRRAKRAEEQADHARQRLCGHGALHFGCRGCEASLRAYQRVLGKRLSRGMEP